MVETFIKEVLNPARLAALRRLGLLNTPAESAFDRLGALAAKILNAPVALVTLVDDQRQFFKSCIGLGEPWATWRGTPLSHSFCQHVLATNEPLILPDARMDPRFVNNLAIPDLGVIAYLGIPLKLNSGEVLGSFCVIDRKPRAWSNNDVEILSQLAASVMTEIELRSEIGYKQSALMVIEQLNEQLHEKTQSLERARDEVEAFGRTVSHDLQAPLRALSSFSQALVDECSGELSGPCLDYTRRIHDAASRMRLILEGLQNLCRLAKHPLEIVETDLTSIARTIVAGLQASAQRNAVIHIQEGLKVRADSRLLQIVLENLLSNAWKFTSKREQTCIEVGCMCEENERIYFVRDNGAGFDDSKADLAFIPFERLHSEKEFAGTGIGLATVKRIVQQHKGRVWVKSHPDQGATFYFTMGETC